MRVLLHVSDGARRQIARLMGANGTVRGKLAHRKEVLVYLQRRLDTLSELYPWWDDEPGLTADERADHEAAIEHLRANGRSDAEIRAWLSLQRARLAMLKLNDSEASQ